MKKILGLLLIMISSYTNGQCWKSFSSSGGGALGIQSNDKLWGWGSNGVGQLGNGSSGVYESYPIPIGNDTWNIIASGIFHTLGIKSDGTLWAWGSSSHGALGTGVDIVDELSPIQIGVDSNWQTVSTIGESSLALKTDGSLWAWGYNANGQLGDGTIENKNVPIQIGSATDWRFIDAGSSNSFGIKNDGTLWAWGWNIFGQFGNGNFDSSLVPIQVGTSNDWKEISTSSSTSVAIKNNGTLWVCGSNSSGALGLGLGAYNTTSVFVNSFTQVGTETTWKSIATGSDHVIATKTDGTLWAWGGNYDGQVGDGTFSNKDVPIHIGQENDWDIVCAGYQISMAVKTDKSLWTWGNNWSGCLGDGTTNNSNIPLQVSCQNLEVSQIKNNIFVVYPNPSITILTIQNLSNSSIENIIITDLSGKKVFEQSGNNSQINIQNLQRGMYLLEIDYEGGKQIEKFIKQ